MLPSIVLAIAYGVWGLVGFLVGLNLMRLATYGQLTLATPIIIVGIWIFSGWLVLLAVRRTNRIIGLTRVRR